MLVSETEADWWHMYQTLCGDTTDGYAGLPGCGPKKAEKVIGTVDEPAPDWAAVAAAFTAKSLSEEDALVQARVARICRASDYDFKNKEVILWTP